MFDSRKTDATPSWFRTCDGKDPRPDKISDADIQDTVQRSQNWRGHYILSWTCFWKNQATKKALRAHLH